MSEMTPREIVSELEKHIVAQDDAKRAVAIALRNRWRRGQLDHAISKEITPKNILMIGPTGVGKTEIARRLASLCGAPFIKVEATKFTEVGYVGREVESIIRDLTEISMKLMREQLAKKYRVLAEDKAEERILDVFVPPASDTSVNSDGAARQLFRKKFREGQLDDKVIEIDITQQPKQVELFGAPGMEEMSNQLQEMFQNVNKAHKEKRSLKVASAYKLLIDEESSSLLNPDEVKAQAIDLVEQNGIVFIDEIDKIINTPSSGRSGGDVSREGVQRDLLPLVEGSSVTTKHGVVKTDHILFITSGAFQLSKPSDLIPELQGRLPIRVELKSLTVGDFVRILAEPQVALIAQYKALLATEGVTLMFEQSSIQRIAEIAWEVNERTENIGARRLHTVLERLLETVSFEASDMNGETVNIDGEYVDKHLLELVVDQDLSRYIL